MTTAENRLGRRIARQRKAAGFTQAQLAERVGVEPETISRIESGTRMPSLDRISLIAKALEVDLHELFRLYDGDDPKQRVIERLSFFAGRLSTAEIDLMMDLGAAVFRFARQNEPRPARDRPTSLQSSNAEKRIGS